jgi:hypothetical protein
VGVILDGKAEMAGRRLSRDFNDIFAGTEKFYYAEREIGKTEWVGCLLFGQEVREGLRIRLHGELEMMLGRNLDDPSPPLKWFSTECYFLY